MRLTVKKPIPALMFKGMSNILKSRAKTLLDKQRLVIPTGDKLLATFGSDNLIYS